MGIEVLYLIQNIGQLKYNINITKNMLSILVRYIVYKLKQVHL